jgi:hypothetical protein
MLTAARQRKPNLTTTNSIQQKSELNMTGEALPFFFQPKLTVGSADDPLEDEADKVADKVMRMQIPEPINFSLSKNTVSRKCTECEEEEKKLQRKESGNDSPGIAPTIVHDVLNSSPGKALDTDARSFMEPRFDYDFSNVKIHDDDLAAKSAVSINALAYTSGNDIVFNSGQYNASSDPGKRLLAHELTHVIQQTGTIQKQEETTSIAEEETSSQTETISIEEETSRQSETTSVEQEETSSQTETTPVGEEDTSEQTEMTAAEEGETTGPQAQFIVEDSEIPAEGQMRKSDFLNQLNIEVCQTVDDALAGSIFSSDNCPYIRDAFARYQNSTPLELEQVLARYEPSTRTAQSAYDLIQLVKVRVYAAATRWLETGDLSDLPEDIRAQIPDGLGFLSTIGSGINSVISGIGSVVSGIGSVVSGIGSLFFKANTGGAEVTQSPVSVMQRLGKGSAIEGSTRSKMENAFGENFSNVEVHTDSNASALSGNMNARAFTVGNHIAFGSGEYQPGTIAGDALMAHELAHTIQQNGNDIFSKSFTQQTDVNAAAENEADAVAEEAVSGIWAGNKLSLKKAIQPKIKNSLSIQRCGSASRPPITPQQVNVKQPGSEECDDKKRQETSQFEKLNPCCTTEMLDEITGHLSNALGYVDNAINRLSDPSDVSDQLWNNFRVKPDSSEVGAIKNMLEIIRNTMQGHKTVTFVCRSSAVDPLCKSKDAPRTLNCVSDPLMTFCGNYKEAASKKTKYLPEGRNWVKTIIHEYVHAACPERGGIFGEDREFYKDKGQYPQTVDKNIWNADCYAWFVIDASK